MPNEIVPITGQLVVDITPAVVSVDFDELNNNLTKYLETYEGLDVESVANIASKDLKLCRTDLLGSYNEIDEARKAIAKICNEPAEEPIKQCKQLLERIAVPLEIVRAEIKKREEAKRQVRYDHLQEVYEEAAEALVASVPFEKLFEKQWCNASYSASKAEDELLKKVQNVIADWQTLKQATLNYPEEAERVFFENLSLKEALDHDMEAYEKRQAIESTNQQVADNRAASDTSPAKVYLLAVEATETGKQNLVQTLKASGLHGTIIPTAFTTAAECAEAVHSLIDRR